MKDIVNDYASLLDNPKFADGVERRDFLKAALGSSFALAAMPVVAQSVIKTDSTGLTAGTVTLTIAGQQVPVYRAQPAGKKNLPVILVISEIFGVHEHIADVARRFAKLGYLALAPDLFVRQGDAVNAEREALMRDIVGHVRP
jgi:carboxymethylenebutenolidase